MITTNKRHVGVDQYGAVYWLGAHPRKELAERLRCQHVQKMYRDNATAGQVAHVGYVIAGLWIEVFYVTPFCTNATGFAVEGVI